MKCRYTAKHEWVRLEGMRAVIGITDPAQQALGDLVFVELPRIGDVLQQGSCAGVVESVKAASDIYAPISGTVVEINTAIAQDPALINKDPQGSGWLFAMTLSEAGQFDQLLDEAAYQRLQK